MDILKTLFQTIIDLFAGSTNGTPNWMMILMWIIGGVLIYLAVKKEMEPTLLLPIGFGAIIMNFPGLIQTTEVLVCKVCDLPAAECIDSVVHAASHITETVNHFAGAAEPLNTLYNAGIANELFPLILFIGIGLYS